jgi:hypothetical protein
MSGLLWAALVVQGLLHKLPYSPPLSSTSTVEGWFLRKCFTLRLGLRFQARAFKYRSELPRGW